MMQKTIPTCVLMVIQIFLAYLNRNVFLFLLILVYLKSFIMNNFIFILQKYITNISEINYFAWAGLGEIVPGAPSYRPVSLVPHYLCSSTHDLLILSDNSICNCRPPYQCLKLYQMI